MIDRFLEQTGAQIPLICGAMYPCSNPELIAAVSGAVVSIGGAGMLLSGTPLSLAIELGGWRGAFAACSVLTLIVAAAIHLGLARAPVPARPSPAQP